MIDAERTSGAKNRVIRTSSAFRDVVAMIERPNSCVERARAQAAVATDPSCAVGGDRDESVAVRRRGGALAQVELTDDLRLAYESAPRDPLGGALGSSTGTAAPLASETTTAFSPPSARSGRGPLRTLGPKSRYRGPTHARRISGRADRRSARPRPLRPNAARACSARGETIRIMSGVPQSVRANRPRPPAKRKS